MSLDLEPVPEPDEKREAIRWIDAAISRLANLIGDLVGLRRAIEDEEPPPTERDPDVTE